MLVLNKIDFREYLQAQRHNIIKRPFHQGDVILNVCAPTNGFKIHEDEWKEEMDKCTGAVGDFKPFAVIDTSTAESTK